MKTPTPNTQHLTPNARGVASTSIVVAVSFVAVVAMGMLAWPNAADAAVELQASGAELCFKCHSELKQKFSQAYVHTPVAMGLCESCHNPHTARFPKLLADEGAELCYSCHEKEKAVFSHASSVHGPIKEGNCAACHDPHAGPQKFQLTKAGSELCLTCHAALKEKPVKVSHPPFEAGKCLTCHRPHTSEQPALLSSRSGKVCRACHDLNKPKIKRAHGPFPMEKADCAQCHNPHGSDHKALIKSVAHPPFAQGRCGSCHQVSGRDPTKTFLTGQELCLTCHATMAKELKKKQVHPPVAGGQCTACHNPHASELQGLLSGKEWGVCLSCHDKVEERFRTAAAFHPEKAGDSRCTICHMPHSADQPVLFAGETLKVCSGCHKAHAALSHPMGGGIMDPRTNQPLTCLSCHDPHGTSQESFVTYPKKRELCIQCHKKLR